MRARVLVGLVLIACCTMGVARADRVDDLAKILQSASSHRVRAQAALVLGRLGDPRAVDVLIAALGDSSDAVRGSAASSLGQLGDQRAAAALERLHRDASEYVRTSAKDASAALAGRPAPLVAGAPVDRSARYFATVNVVKGSAEASQALKQYLIENVAKLPRITTSLDATAQKLTAWELDASIVNLSSAGERLDCDVELVIQAMPARSMRARLHAGASWNGMRPGNEVRAQRECLRGASQLLAEDVDKFFKSL